MQQLRQLLNKVQPQAGSYTVQNPTAQGPTTRRTRAATYRLRKIHEDFDHESLTETLRKYFDIEDDAVKVYSLAYDAPYGRSYRQKIATITFKAIPSVLRTGNQWSIQIPLPGETGELCDVCFDTTFEGFTSLTPAELEDKTNTDCILVHGWAGHSIGSFSSPDGDWLWPRDSLCREIPQLRVWFYGYSSDLRDSGSITDVYDYADTFRRALADARRCADSKVASRPLIFIVHSLGGWILQDAIVRMAASNNPDDKVNLNMTKGALLFGVPTTGMQTQEIIGLLQEDNLPAIHTASLLDNRHGFRQQMKQADDFHDACSKSKTLLFAFYETEKTPTVCRDEETKRWARNGPAALLVSQDSATYGRFEYRNKIPWKSNHNNMLKLRKGDIQYETLLSRLQEILQYIEENKAAGETLLPQLSAEQKACLQSLAFSEMNYRRDDISAPTEGTCIWLSEHPTYQAWLNRLNRVLWVKGHPGTGKSTIMSYALDLSSTLPKDEIVISYFFNGRGKDIQKNLLGLFRSFLHQLLSSSPFHLLKLTSIYDIRKDTRGSIGEAWNWQEKELRDEFQKYVLDIAQKRDVRIYVDALDEAGEDNAKKFLNFVKVLTGVATSHISICFSSRHYPSVSFNSNLEIYVERENKNDIKTYVETKFSTGEFDESMGEVQRAILEKANRSFQWTVVVVDRISDLYEQGHNSSFLLEAISTTPQDLTKLYRYLLAQIKGDEDRALALRVFQWIIFAERSLTLTEMRLAMILKEEMASWKSYLSSKFYPRDVQAMYKRLRTLSAGLAECRQADDPQLDRRKDQENSYVQVDNLDGGTAQLIHQSVLDFLMQEGLASLGSPLQPDIITATQISLTRQCFYRAVMRIDTALVSLEDWMETPLDDLPDAAEFDEQSNKACYEEMLDLCQDSFESDSSSEDESIDESDSDLDSHPSDEYIRGSSSSSDGETDSIEDPTMDNHSDSSSDIASSEISGSYREYPNWTRRRRWKLYMANQFPLLEYCLMHLPTHLKAVDAIQNPADVRRKIIPLFLGEHSLLPEWLKVNDSSFQLHRLNSSSTLLHLAARWGIQTLLDAGIEAGLDINAPFTDSGATPLFIAAAGEDSCITKTLLQQKSIQVNTRTDSGGTPLGRSMRNHQFDVVKILLAREDIKVTATDHRESSALCVAISQAYPAESDDSSSELEHPEVEEIISLLLQRDDIDINSKNSLGETPLMYASEFSTEAIVRLLFRHGAQVNDQDNDGKTALHLAVASERPHIVKLLLSYGANSNIITRHKQTAAHLAAEENLLEVLPLLVNKDNVNAQDKDGYTVLHHVTENGDIDSMKLLLNANADITIREYGMGDTAAHCAISCSEPKALALLLEKGVNPNTTNDVGATLLHHAAAEGDLQAIELLLDAKADIKMTNPDTEETAAHYAISSPAALALLLQNGADPNAGDLVGESLLHFAAEEECFSSMRLLLAANTDTTLENTSGETAFLMAGQALCKRLGYKTSRKGAVGKILYGIDHDGPDVRELQKDVLLNLLDRWDQEESSGKYVGKRHIKKSSRKVRKTNAERV